MRHVGSSVGALALTVVLSAAALSAPASLAELGVVHGDTLTVSRADVVRAALDRNEMLQASGAMTDAASAQALGAWTGFLPRLSLGAYQIRSTDALYGFGFKLNQRRATQADFSAPPMEGMAAPAPFGDALNYPGPSENNILQVKLQQPVFNGGMAIYGKKAADAMARAAESSHRRAEETVRMHAVQAYEGLVLARAYATVLNQALATADAHVAQARAMVENELIVEADLLQARVHRDGVRQQLITARNMVRTAGEHIKLLTALETDLVLAPADANAEPPAGAAVLDGVGLRADLQASADQAAAAGHMAKVARGAMIPHLNLQAEKNWYHRDDLFGNEADAWTFGVYATWDVFSGLQNVGAMKKARAESRAASWMHDFRTRQARVEAQQAAFELESARERLAVARDAVDRRPRGPAHRHPHAPRGPRVDGGPAGRADRRHDGRDQPRPGPPRRACGPGRIRIRRRRPGPGRGVIAMQNNRRIPTMNAKLSLAAALLLVLAVTGCSEKAPEVRPVGESVRGVTARVQLRELPVISSAVASVEPETRVHLSTRMMGWVSVLHAAEGDTVQKGQKLLTIDDADMRAKRAQVEAGIREAEAVVANAERMAARFRNLYEAKAVSKAQLEDVETGLERAQAGLAQARAARSELNVHLGYLDLKAPMDGVVTRRMVDVGDMAAPGHPLLFLDKLDRMKIVASLGEKDINAVRAGDTVTAHVTSLDRATFQVEVARLINSANPGSRTYDLEMYVENDGRLRPGMFARVDVPVGTRRGVVVPEAAVHRRGQLTGVWIVDAAGAAHLRWVRLGDPVAGGVEVISGLDGTETVVTSSEQPLAEGDKVVS